MAAEDQTPENPAEKARRLGVPLTGQPAPVRLDQQPPIGVCGQCGRTLYKGAKVVCDQNPCPSKSKGQLQRV